MENDFNKIIKSLEKLILKLENANILGPICMLEESQVLLENALDEYLEDYEAKDEE